MKSVCISTFCGTDNYGSNLQAIGLSEFFKSNGYEVFFLPFFKNRPFTLLHPMLFYSRLINRINRKKFKEFFISEPYALSAEREERLSEFCNEHFHIIDFRSCKQWNDAIRQKMIFVAGSDIIWNPAMGYPSTFFLDFAYYAKLPRFSYGTSVGAKELPRKYYKAYKRYLGTMKAVGVREEIVVDMFEPIIGFRPTKVVDPSLLLAAEQWDAITNRAMLSVEISKRGFILCYFVMNDARYWEYVKKVKEDTKLQIIVLPMHKNDEKQEYDVVLDGTPYEFLWLIKNAEFICTDSFHACVVSMIYHKEFYLLRRTRKSEDAKYKDLLTRYHLTDRIVEEENEFKRKPSIDYSYADKQLSKDRDFSVQFIGDALQKCEK